MKVVATVLLFLFSILMLELTLERSLRQWIALEAADPA